MLLLLASTVAKTASTDACSLSCARFRPTLMRILWSPQVWNKALLDQILCYGLAHLSKSMERKLSMPHGVLSCLSCNIASILMMSREKQPAFIVTYDSTYSSPTHSASSVNVVWDLQGLQPAWCTIGLVDLGGSTPISGPCQRLHQWVYRLFEEQGVKAPASCVVIAILCRQLDARTTASLMIRYSA